MHGLQICDFLCVQQRVYVSRCTRFVHSCNVVLICCVVQVTKFDVEAVAALDKNLPFMDSQMAHLVSCPLPSERSLISSNTASSGTTLHAVETPTATVTTHADTTSPSASAVMSGAADTPTVDMTTASGSTTSISNHSLVVVA